MQAERLKREESQQTSQYSDVNNIQHIVSKMDTVAGLAIKYGVEVADIKKLNGLVTDHQMFALRSVQIPLPAKHPPSPGAVAANISASNRLYDDPFSSFSPSKLKYHPQKALPVNPVVASDRHPNHHRRARSLAVQDFPEPSRLADDGSIDISGDNKAKISGNMNSVRRRQKADTDPVLIISEPENAESIAARTGKALMFSRDTGHISPSPLGDPSRVNKLGSVRKSSSTSNLQQLEINSSTRSSMSSPKPEGLLKPIKEMLSLD